MEKSAPFDSIVTTQTGLAILIKLTIFLSLHNLFFLQAVSTFKFLNFHLKTMNLDSKDVE